VVLRETAVVYFRKSMSSPASAAQAPAVSTEDTEFRHGEVVSCPPTVPVKPNDELLVRHLDYRNSWFVRTELHGRLVLGGDGARARGLAVFW